jgi:hypothetical protein
LLLFQWKAVLPVIQSVPLPAFAPRVWASALAALALVAASGVAEARLCRIPRALLCESCARVVTLSLSRDGNCIVSSRRDAGKQSLRGAAGRDLIVHVRPAPRPLLVARALAPRVPAGPGRCFVFNERRYCE